MSWYRKHGPHVSNPQGVLWNTHFKVHPLHLETQVAQDATTTSSIDSVHYESYITYWEALTTLMPLCVVSYKKVLETKTPLIKWLYLILWTLCVYFWEIHKELCNTYNLWTLPSFIFQASQYYDTLKWFELHLIVVEHVFVEFIGIKENIHTSFYYP